MVTMLEGKCCNIKQCGPGRRGLAGLARLRQECERFREEVVCIRTFPLLHLRWPSLARLEIGNESSDDGSVWDPVEAERHNISSILRQKGVAEACPKNAVDLPSPKLASLHIDTKAEGAVSDEQLSGFKENDRRYLEDLQIGQKTHDIVDISRGCEDGAGAAVCSVARNDEDAMKSQGSFDGTSELKSVDQVVEPLTAVETTSNSSHDGSFIDPESVQDSPKGHSQSTVLTDSGARIAATAHFTANPHYNSRELSTDCNPNCKGTCPSKGFKLVGFPGSNVSDNASRKEREVWSEQFLCSSFESHIRSPSELSGYSIMDERNQTSTPIETNSLEVGGKAFDGSSDILQAQPDMRLLRSLPLVAPNCSSNIDYEWDTRKATIGLSGPEFCMAPVHAYPFLTGANQNARENVKQTQFGLQTSNCPEDHRLPTFSVGESSRTSVDYTQLVNVRDQSWLAEQSEQQHDFLLTNESPDGQTLPTTFMSDLAETSSFPISGSLQNGGHVVSPTEIEPHVRALKKRGSGRLGLIRLSGLTNFAKLGVGSTCDSVMTAQMAKRIKQALEKLGNIGSQKNGHRKSFVSENRVRWTDGHSQPTYDSKATSESTIVRSALKRFTNPDRLLRENSEIERLESHCFNERNNGERMLGSERMNKRTHVETPFEHPIHESKSGRPEEPDLYLQSVIAALDSTYKPAITESTLETSTATTGLESYQHGFTVGQDGGVSTELSKAHVNGHILKCHEDKGCVVDHKILDSTSALPADPPFEEKQPSKSVKSTCELLPHGYPIEEESVAEASNEELPAFSVQISASPGSFLRVEVGGHRTVSDELDEAHDQVLGNSLNYPSSTEGYEGKFNVRVGHRKLGSLQQRCLETAPSKLQDRPVNPSDQVIDPIFTLNEVEKGRQTKQATRFNTQEDLRCSFDRKITSLIKKANQHREETMRPNTSPRKHRSSGFHQRRPEVTGPFVHGDDYYEDHQGPTEYTDDRGDVEKKDAARANERKVRKAPRPSVLKSSLKPKAINSESTSRENHRDRQALEAFEAAATGLAHELNVLMKDRRSGQKLEGLAPNKRKVAWASPEAYELGASSAIEQRISQSEMQPASTSLTQSTEKKKMRGNSARPDNAALSAAQAVRKVWKITDQQKGSFVKQSKAPRLPPCPQKRSVGKDSDNSDAVIASPFPKLVRNKVTQETGIKSKKLLSVRQRGRTQETKVPDDSTCENFDYNQFRQELKDLQSERMKLETLVQTIFTTDADPMQEGKPADVLAGRPQKAPEFTIASAIRDPILEDGDKSERSTVTPNRNSGLHISPNTEDNGLGTNHLLKSSHLPTNEGLKKQSDNGDPGSLRRVNRQDNCTAHRILDINSVQQNKTGVSHPTLKHNSDNLQCKNRLHDVVKSTILSHPLVERKTNHRVGSILEQEKHVEKSPSSSFPRGEAFNSDRQDVKDVPEKNPGYATLPVSGSGTQLQEQDQNICLDGKSESETHLLANFGFSSTDVLPSLSRVFSGEDATPNLQSGCAASKLQVAKPHFFKEFLLQALDSSILLLQHCVTHSEDLEDTEVLNPSTEVATKMTEKCLDSHPNELNCNEGFSEETTQVTVSADNLEELDEQTVLDHLQKQGNELDSSVQLLQESQSHLKDGNVPYHQKPEPILDPPRSRLPLEQSLESLEPQVEVNVAETQKMALDQSQESKLSSSEKEASWSGSLKSVMEAFEEAQRSAALLMSSSREVQKPKGRRPFSCRSEISENPPGAEKKKIQMEGALKRKEKFSQLTLLERAEKAEAKELKLRLAHKKFLKSKQKLLKNAGLVGEVDKLQGRLIKRSSGREQWKVPKLVYRTAEFGLKRREEWNDSTEVSENKYATGWNTKAKDAAQALITKVLNEELAKSQRRQGIKNLQAVKPLEAGMRRKRKDLVNLETYASTIGLMSGLEKPSLIHGNPSIVDRSQTDKTKLIQDVVHTGKSPTPLSKERTANDRANYFTVSRNVLETERHVLDKSTMVFKKTREDFGSGNNVINQDLRESIEHWLDTSGGFEFLDSYNEIGEEHIFERQESTNSMQRNASFSMATRVSGKILSEDKLSCLGPEIGGRRTSRTSESERMKKCSRGDLVCISNRNSTKCSLVEHHDTFPHRVESGRGDDHASGLSAHSSLKIDKSSLGGSFGTLNGGASDEIVREFPSQEPAHIDSNYSEATYVCRKDASRLGRSMCPPSSRVTSDKKTENFQDENARRPPSEEKLTEEEELEVALLEIVLHTILKDDPSSGTAAKLTSGVPATAEGHSIGSSGTRAKACGITPCSTPVSVRVTPISIGEKRLQDGVDQGVQTFVPNLLSLDLSMQDQGIDSAKSSGGDWPEYKCLAEMHSGSQSLEDEEHWPKYNGVDEPEDGVDLDQGGQIEELPSDQISSSSTNEGETNEKQAAGTVLPQATAVSTRPPYSAVHSMRAAEREPIDFPGIASLAFGYPSPRPPPSKLVGQTSINRSSASVQTSDMPITQSAPLSTSVFVIPYYCLPPYSMYLPPPPPPASQVPFQASSVPMAVSGQHGAQFTASQYTAAPAGLVSMFPPPYMFPPSNPFSQGVSQTTVMPVAPTVQNSQQTPTTAYPLFPPSSSHPSARDGPSQSLTAVKLAPKSDKRTSSRSRKLCVDVTEQAKLLNRFSDKRDSPPSLDSCRSSLATPSTILSSPEHESRVASALARRNFQGTADRVFEKGSSDEAEASGLEELGESKQHGDIRPSDQGVLPPPYATTVKEEEDPLLLSIIAENSYKQLRTEIAPARHSLPTDMATPDEFILNQHVGRRDKLELGASYSVDSARSSVVVASYDDSGSSEGTVKRTRGKAHMQSSGQSSLDGLFKHMSSKGQVGSSQTSSRSSREFLVSNAMPSHGLEGNQKILRSHFFSRTLPLSEGEVEPGQLPSEGEYLGPYPNVLGSHPRLLLSRPTKGRDITSEPGEISSQAFIQLRPPRSEVEGDDSSRSQSLSEGELRLETLTEPGEVIRNRKVPKPQGATGSDDLAKRRETL